MLLTIEMINIIYKGDIQSNKIVKKKILKIRNQYLTQRASRT